MDDYESLSHSKWECKYHVVSIPKCGRKTLYVELRRHLGEVFRRTGAVSAIPSRFERLTNSKPPALPGDAYSCTGQEPRIDFGSTIRLRHPRFVTVGRLMIARRYGRIINMSSQAGFIALPARRSTA
jgi:hypothetical protein